MRGGCGRGSKEGRRRHKGPEGGRGRYWAAERNAEIAGGGGGAAAVKEEAGEAGVGCEAAVVKAATKA